MMKTIIIWLMLGLPLIGFAQQQKFKIRGQLSGVPKKAKVYLFHQAGNDMVIDSARVLHGAFELSGTVASPVEATLILSHTGLFPKDNDVDSRSVYLENGVVDVKGKDSLAHCQVSGPPLNMDNQKRFRPANSDGYAPGKQEIKAMAAFVPAHPASLVSLDWMWAVGGRDSTVVANYPKLSAALKQTRRGKELGLAVKASLATRIGQIAPDFTLADQNGHPVKLSDLRGKYVLLDFWASWCHPCRDLQPKLLELYNELKSTGKFVILAVSLDKDKSAWLKAIKEDNVPWMQVADLNKPVNKAAELYNVTIIPASFLIDPDGKVIGLGMNRELLKDRLLEPVRSEAEVEQAAENMYYLKPQKVLEFFSKDNITEADVLEDCNALNKVLRQDIGEKAMLKELDKLDMVKDSAAFFKIVQTKPVKLYQEKLIMTQQFVADHPDSYVSLYQLEDINDMYSADSYALAYDKLSDRLKRTHAAQGVRNRIDEWKRLTAKGKKAANFTRKDQHGKNISLSDFKGKVVLLDFWGSWCGACRQGHPHLKEVYETYKNKGLEIIAIANENRHGANSLEKSKAAWLAAIKKDDINWVHVLNDEGTGATDIIKQYEIDSYPTKILLDQNGKVLMRVSSLLNVEIDQLIKQALEK